MLLQVLTLIVIFGGDSKNGMLYIFIFINFCLVQRLIEIRGVVILKTQMKVAKIDFTSNYLSNEYENTEIV